MAFGGNFQREEGLPIAIEGEHIVTLTKIEERFKNEWHFLEFTFEYLDKKPRLPNKFCLFEAPFGSGEKGQHAFNVNATRIIDCFGLKGGFAEENYKNWKNSTGKIELRKDKNGYMCVKRFIPKEKKENAGVDPVQDFFG